MTDRDRQTAPEPRHDPAVARALAALDASVAAYDDATLSRLAGARRAAVARARARSAAGRRERLSAPPRAAFASIAALGLVAIVMISAGRAPQGPAQPPAIVTAPRPTAPPFALLVASEDLEFLEELEFYEWLELERTGDRDDAGATS